MFELPLIELVLFLTVLLLYIGAGIVGIVQIAAGNEKYKPVMTHLFAVAVVLEAIMLIFRAARLKAFPLVGLFESMLMLTMVFGIVYLILGIFVRQVWFGSMMSWFNLGAIMLATTTAGAGVVPSRIASDYHSIIHGILMIMGQTMILLATVSAFIYLLADYRLKHKQINKVMGLVPNLQLLDKLIIWGLRGGFILVTLGIAGGVGQVYNQTQGQWSEIKPWLIDFKVITIMAMWLWLGWVNLLRIIWGLSGSRMAWMTIITTMIIIISLFGVISGLDVRHKFSLCPVKDTTGVLLCDNRLVAAKK